MMDENADNDEWRRYLTLAASGGLTGLGLGSIGKLLSGSRSIPSIVGAGLLGGATGATLVPGAARVGEEVLGAPTADELQPYTIRSALGGGLAGGALGAAGGALAGSSLPEKIGTHLPGATKFAKSQLPLDNLIIDYLKKAGKLKGGLIGGALGAAGLGFMAADEGQQIDTFRNLLKKE